VTAVADGQSGQPMLNLLITTVYTCDDNSGTFDMLKHVFITFNPDGSFTNTGPVQILGGTGAYVGLIRRGMAWTTAPPAATRASARSPAGCSRAGRAMAQRRATPGPRPEGQAREPRRSRRDGRSGH
jgi:hypothetical protein